MIFHGKTNGLDPGCDPVVLETAILVAMMDFMIDFITTFQGSCDLFDQLTAVTFLIRILQMVRWQGMRRVGN